MIDVAIDYNSTSKKVARMEAAKANSWEARVEAFWEIIR
jgi:hypothetical protein